MDIKRRIYNHLLLARLLRAYQSKGYMMMMMIPPSSPLLLYAFHLFHAHRAFHYVLLMRLTTTRVKGLFARDQNNIVYLKTLESDDKIATQGPKPKIFYSRSSLTIFLFTGGIAFCFQAGSLLPRSLEKLRF